MRERHILLAKLSQGNSKPPLVHSILSGHVSPYLIERFAIFALTCVDLLQIIVDFVATLL